MKFSNKILCSIHKYGSRTWIIFYISCLNYKIIPKLWTSRHSRSQKYLFYMLSLTRPFYGIQNITLSAQFFWSVNYTISKIHFLCSDNMLQIFKYTPIVQTNCIDAYRINYVDQKMVLQSNICISLGKGSYNDIRTPFKFRQENNFKITTLLQR